MTNIKSDMFPPGEFIRDELEARNWTQEDLAEILGRPLRTVNQIIAGKKAITPQTAQELAAAFGTTAELWLNLENAYRLALEAQEQSSVVRRSRLYQLAPVKDMIKRRWITSPATVDELESVVMRFMEIRSLDEQPHLDIAARKSTSYGVTTPAQMAWCLRAKHLAKSLQVCAFDKSKAEKMLPDLHALTVSENESRKVPAVLAEMGIRFLVVEHLPRTRIDGATMWLDELSPVIAVSLRYDRIDGFWHTLAHELSHVFHGDRSVDIDLVGAQQTDTTQKPEAEQRADEDASAFLIAPDKLESFILRHKPRFSKTGISRFANLHQIHPGIVVGQLQFRKAILYSHSREMLVPVREIVTSTAITDGWGGLLPS
jgi:HTH-type transcriptional regulator / antitoxin HigA